jgi:hypothetical protein
MKTIHFFGFLAVCVLISILIVLGFDLITTFKGHKNLGWILILFFVLLSLGIWILGRISAKSANKSSFIGLIMMVTFIKLFLTVGIIMIYKSAVAPTNKLFVVPGLLVYLIFSIFETTTLALESNKKS